MYICIYIYIYIYIYRALPVGPGAGQPGLPAALRAGGAAPAGGPVYHMDL